jgi:Uma2 family endonuclease
MVATQVRYNYEKSLLPKRISIKTFMEKYREGGAGVKYEWNDGILETYSTMKQIEVLIYYNLLQVFKFTKAAERGAVLTEETEVWTTETKFRKPDICFWEKMQVMTSFEGINNIPRFAIEVISTNDQANMIKSKLIECFNAGFEVIWHIYPEQRTVEIYTSPKNITVCTGDDICTGENVMPDLQITVNQLFKIDKTGLV